jgi:hypothetical protein
MLVPPPSIRPDDLPIDEADGWLPHVNPRPPGQRQPVKPDPIRDLQPNPHLSRHRRHNREVQPRRSEALQIGRIREERERLFERCGNEDVAVEMFDVVRRADVGGQQL